MSAANAANANAANNEGKPTLLVATHNAGKLAELRNLLRDAPYALASLADVGIDADVEETGATLEENAALKAVTYARLSGMLTLADDSGLEVDALGGAPGVYSARYAGAGASDADRIAKLLANLASRKPPWTARFRCVIAIARAGGAAELHAGVCEGVIIAKPRGENGFGYDPVFLLPEFGKTMAELSDAEKNRVSHRGLAARRVVGTLGGRGLGLGLGILILRCNGFDGLICARKYISTAS